jgi:uncharacterized lipoprotein YbaY
VTSSVTRRAILATALAGLGARGATAAAPVVVEIQSEPPAVLPPDATIEVKILEGAVADHPATPIFGIARLPAGGRTLPVAVTVPLLDQAALGKAMRPILDVRVLSGAGRLLFVNTKRTPLQPGGPQRVRVDPIP